VVAVAKLHHSNPSVLGSAHLLDMEQAVDMDRHFLMASLKLRAAVDKLHLNNLECCYAMNNR
jgi:hypothetical protein